VRQVPLARRNLFEDRRRALLALVGVGSGLLLVLLMSGIFAGFTRQETAYLDATPVDVVVSQAGVTTMQMSTSSLPGGTLLRLQAVPGVAWVEPLRQSTATLGGADGTKLISYVIGFDALTGKGGPPSLSSGQAPGLGDVVIDEAGAAQLGVGIGDHIQVFGTPLRISGLTHGLTSVANTTVFVTANQYRALAGNGTNYALVTAAPGVDPGELRDRIAAAIPNVTAQTKAQFTAQEQHLVEDMYIDVIRTMNAVGFVIALALVALTLSSVTAANLREYGVVKALGATKRHLAGVVVAQAVWAVLGAMLVATALSVALAFLVDATVPNIVLAIEPRTVLSTLAVALVVGAPAALLPLRRVLRVDPAAAFRGAA
jgi:putative ABC transport system permease protein